MKERISALMDGELDDPSAAVAIDALSREGEAREAWRTYHLISDALAKGPMLSQGFSARIAAELAREPTVLAPGRRKPVEPRRWVAVAAGVVAVSLVGWLGFAPQRSAVAPVAQAPVSVVSQEATPAVVPLPSGADDYLLAHQRFSPRVFPYVRTVSSEQPQEPRR